jgi:beta-N-acetylhexosaminidase
MCTFSGNSISELSAIKALFGEIPIRGHLPVTIPGIAARGAGIMRPAFAPARSSLFDGGTIHNAKAN